MPGVSSVSEGAVAPELLGGLDEAEALFVSAWASRSEVPKLPRPGDGVDWDAGGFEPPDPPPEVELDGFGVTRTEDE